MRQLLLALPLLLGQVLPAQAQVSVGIGVSLPGVSIGINMPAYPQLVRVPGYPVYYAPSVNSNYFFYDGLYWVYQDDDWYSSDWYNGPWQLVGPTYVPLFVLRVPVRYYREPPIYFGGWRPDAAPRWGDHWGHDWQNRRRGWDQWDRRRAPAAAPLPAYQRNYSGDRYPRAAEQQRAVRAENYRYQPREAVSRQQFQERGGDAAPARAEPRQQAPAQAPQQRSVPPPPRSQPEQPARAVPSQPHSPPDQPRQREQQREQPQQREQQREQQRQREQPQQQQREQQQREQQQQQQQQRAQPEQPRPQAQPPQPPQREPQGRGQGQDNKGESQDRGGRDNKGGPPDKGRDK